MYSVVLASSEVHANATQCETQPSFDAVCRTLCVHDFRNRLDPKYLSCHELPCLHVRMHRHLTIGHQDGA